MTRELQPLSDEEIMQQCLQELSDAETGTADIGKEREDSLEFYRNDPIGNEVEGRSKVQTSDVYENNEWLLAQLIELFMGNDRAVEFSPKGNTVEDVEADVERAKQETEYANWVLTNDNEGYEFIHNWFKDALLQKNGIAKVWWDEVVEPEKETYEELSHKEYLDIIGDEDVDVRAETLFINGEEQDSSDFDEPETLEEAVIRLATWTHSLEVMRTWDNSQIRIESIAPENFVVRRNHNSVHLDDVQFCAHIEQKTISELHADGLDLDLLLSIPFDDNLNEERITRFEQEGGLTADLTTSDNKVSREVWVTECYVRVDVDGDGIQELMKVTLGGAGELGGGTVLLDTEEVDSIPFIAITPTIMPHKFYGMSIADVIREIQSIKTALLRQMMDGLYIANNPRYVVNEESVNMDDVLSSEVGAPIRVTDINGINNFTTPFVGAQSLPIMDLMDDYAERRSGVSKTSQGLDPAALKDQSILLGTRLMNASMQRVLFIARTFAEIGFKPLMLKIHELARKYEKNSKIAEIAGKYVEVDPRGWRKRSKMRVLVGTGNTSMDQKLVSLQGILDSQRQVFELQGGEPILVNPQNVYNALSDLVKLSGLQDVDRYFINPADAPPAPPPPPPPPGPIDAAIMDIETRAQTEIAKIQAAAQTKQQELIAEQQRHEDRMVLEREKLLQKAKNDEEELELERQQSVLKSVSDSQKEQTKRTENAIDTVLKVAEAQEKSRDSADVAQVAKIIETVSANQGAINDRVAESLNQIATAGDNNSQAQADALQQISTVVQETSVGLGDIVKGMNKKKRVITDDDGNPTGVETVEE